MVRIIVGTLCKVGYHFYPPEHVKEILNSRDRKAAGPKAPAEGLKLVSISYNPEDMMPESEWEFIPSGMNHNEMSNNVLEFWRIMVYYK